MSDAQLFLLAYAGSVVVAFVVLLRIDGELESSRFMLAMFAILWPLTAIEWAKAAAEDARRSRK